MPFPAAAQPEWPKPVDRKSNWCYATEVQRGTKSPLCLPIVEMRRKGELEERMAGSSLQGEHEVAGQPATQDIIRMDRSQGRERLWHWLVLGTLILLLGLTNWQWLATNVTLMGWDVPSHLGTSYVLDSILRPVNLQTLFEATIWHPQRPPLLFLSAVPLFRLFGLSADVGTMVNVLYLAILIASTYAIGQRLGGWKAGLLAAFSVATLPMIFGIAHYFNIELALAAMVALSLYLLLASERFESRSASLLFGLSFGLGLLTKRTYPVFVFVPLAFVVLRSNALQSFRQRLRAGIRFDFKWALLSLAIGTTLAAIWYLPSREFARNLLFGDWLLPMWALLIATTIYLLRQEPAPDTNLLAALFLGGTVGSIWYLPRITFLERLLRFGYGVSDPWERSANLGDLSTYLYFPVRLINEHLSLVTFAFLVVAVAGLAIVLWRKGRLGSSLWRANDAWWVTTLWVLGSYLILTFSLYRKSRGITPVLPALALILAAGLFRLPWKKAISLLVVLFVAWASLQFYVLSYEPLNWLAERTRFSAPLLGDSGLFAQGGPLHLPASGDTDPGYWVVPDILQTVDSGRQALGADRIDLGVLVNNEYVNPDLFGLMALQSYPAIQPENLARTWSEGSVYGQLFEEDYLVLIEDNYLWIDPAAEDALQHLAESPAFFEAAFELERRFPLPDGDTVLLYRREWQPEPGMSPADYQGIAQSIETWSQEGDAIVLVPPTQVAALGRAYDGPLPPYLLPQDQSPGPVDTIQALEQISAEHRLLFVVFHDEGAVDPDRTIEGWLVEHAYPGPSEWHGGTRLVVYGAPSGIEAMGQPLEASLGQQVRLLGYALAEEGVEAGDMVRLDLFWQADEPLDERYTVFVHLLDGEGRLVAQQDSEPLGGLRPTTTWLAGEVIHDRVGVLLPTDLAAGDYQIVVGMYNPEGGDRLPVTVIGEPVPSSTDSIPLTVIQVR